MPTNGVRVFAVYRAGELGSKALGEPAGCVLRLARARREEGPIAGIEAMSRDISFEDIWCIARRVGGDRDELHLVSHRRQVDHFLQLRDELAVQRAKVLAAGIDEIQHDDLASQSVEIPWMTLAVLEVELGCGTAQWLEKLLLALKLRLELLHRVGAGPHR